MLKFQSKSFSRSVLYALNGVRIAFKSQRNFRKHLLINIFILLIGFFLKLPLLQMCFLLFLCMFVLVCEMFNSIIEFVIDAYYKNKWARLAKFAKDLGAGVVLIASCTSVFISCVLFCAKLCENLP